MTRRFKVTGRLDMGQLQVGTVTITDKGLFAVRPLRRRRQYVLPLSAVAEIVCARVIRAELLEKRGTRGRRIRRAA